MKPVSHHFMQPIASMPNVQDRFVAFVQEREDARHAKNFGVVPHTSDPIIAVNKFCNVNREHDRVTVWVKEHVREDQSLSHDEMVKHLLVARIFNNPASLQHVIPFSNLDHVAIRLNALRKQGQPVFRGAYMMVVHGEAGRGKNAIDFYCNLVKTVGMLGIGEAGQQLEDVANLINSVNGLGRFMANQVVTDLRYTRFYPQHSTKDWTTFVWGGPGTIRGLRRFHGLDVATGKWKGIKGCLGAKDAGEHVLAVREWLTQGKKLPSEILEHFEDPNNLSNCFCEFDKYERVLGLVPGANDRKATLRKYSPPQQ